MSERPTQVGRFDSEWQEWDVDFWTLFGKSSPSPLLPNRPDRLRQPALVGDQEIDNLRYLRFPFVSIVLLLVFGVFFLERRPVVVAQEILDPSPDFKSGEADAVDTVFRPHLTNDIHSLENHLADT